MAIDIDGMLMEFFYQKKLKEFMTLKRIQLYPKN